jgi:hypothetical protein
MAADALHAVAKDDDSSSSFSPAIGSRCYRGTGPSWQSRMSRRRTTQLVTTVDGDFVWGFNT